MTRLLRFLGVQAGEERLAAGLFAYSLSLGVGRVFVLTASQAIFLDNYPASDLAIVYMVAAGATIAASAGYLALGRRVSGRPLLVTNLAFTLGVTVALRLLLEATAGSWPAIALAAWFHVMFALSSFAFWGAATQVVDIRQGKRLFPVATTGDVVAFSLGGLAILRTVDGLGTANLLWIASAGFGLAIVALVYTLSTSATRPEGRSRADRRKAPPSEVRWSSRYLRLMMAYFVLSAVVFIFLDNAFNDVAQRRFEGAAALARFFATYSAVAAIVNFFFRSLIAGRLVRRFGLVLGLAILPAVVGIGAVGIGLGGTLLPGLAFVFWLTTATRLSDKVLRGVQYSSVAALYQPLGPRGPAVQTTMDGIIDSAAIGLSGLALLGLHRAFDMGAVELSFVLVGLCGAWVWTAISLHKEFVGVLQGVLHRRRLTTEAIDPGEAGVLDLVRDQLASAYPEEVVYALGLLARGEDPELPDLLVGLLDHDSPEVRTEALRWVAELGVSEAEGRAREMVADDSLASELRGAAARTLGQLSAVPPVEVLEALRSVDRTIRRGAIVGLLRSGSIESIVYAGSALLEDLGSDRPAARVSAAEALRDAALPTLYRQILPLLDDEDREVRKTALEAAAAVDHAEVWPRVVDLLEDPAMAPAASEALLRSGPHVIPHLMRDFDRERRDRSFRLAALKIVGLLGGTAAPRALLPRIGEPDRELRTAVLTALAHCGLDAAPEEMAALEAQLHVELSEAADAFAALADLEGIGAGEAIDQLRVALEEEIQTARRRLFLLLSFIKPGSDLLTAWENYASGRKKRRAYALELLDSHLDNRERGRIFPVLEDAPLAERLEALGRSATPRRMEPGERLAALASDRRLSLWTRLCAARTASDFDTSILLFADSEDALYRAATRVRRVELFEELTGTDVLRMIPKLEEVSVEAGETIIRKGEEGSSMYIILSGRVRVHDADRELAVLGPDQVMGEFTVLQSSPRTASVTALEGTRLLRLGQEDLYELIREQVGVARALIRVIVRRLTRERPGLSPSAPATPG